MHELALMDSVMSIVRSSAQQRDIRRVTKIMLVIGEFSMVVPDSLRFAFEALSQEEIFQGTELELKLIPLLCGCRLCAQEYVPRDHYDLICPYCSSDTVDILAGRELQIEYYEGE